MIMLNGKDSFWLQLEVCREYQRSRCTRSDGECKFAHPPTNVEIQSNGRVTACYDSIKGRCQRESCKYMHPPAHLKDQLLINGRNHLALKNALLQQQHFQDPHSQHTQSQHQQQHQQQQAALFQSAVAAAQQHLNPHHSHHHHHHHQTSALSSQHTHQQPLHLKPATPYDLSMRAHPAAALAAAIAASSMNPFMAPGAFTHSYASQYAAAVAAAQHQQQSPRVPSAFGSAPAEPAAKPAKPAATPSLAGQLAPGPQAPPEPPAKQTIKAPPTHYGAPALGQPDPALAAAYYMATPAAIAAAAAAMLGPQSGAPGFGGHAYPPASAPPDHYQSVLSALYAADSAPLYPGALGRPLCPTSPASANGKSCDKLLARSSPEDKKKIKTVDNSNGASSGISASAGLHHNRSNGNANQHAQTPETRDIIWASEQSGRSARIGQIGGADDELGRPGERPPSELEQPENKKPATDDGGAPAHKRPHLEASASRWSCSSCSSASPASPSSDHDRSSSPAKRQDDTSEDTGAPDASQADSSAPSGRPDASPDKLAEAQQPQQISGGDPQNGTCILAPIYNVN